MFKKIILAVAMSSLAACASQSAETERPIGVGKGINNLQRSPCACEEVQLPGEQKKEDA